MTEMKVGDEFTIGAIRVRDPRSRLLRMWHVIVLKSPPVLPLQCFRVISVSVTADRAQYEEKP